MLPVSANAYQAARRGTQEGMNLSQRLADRQVNMLLLDQQPLVIPRITPGLPQDNTSMRQRFFDEVRATTYWALPPVFGRVQRQGLTFLNRLKGHEPNPWVNKRSIQRLVRLDAPKALARLRDSQIPLSALDNPAEKILAHRLFNMPLI